MFFYPPPSKYQNASDLTGESSLCANYVVNSFNCMLCIEGTMKRTILLVITCIATLLFAGCANNSGRNGVQIEKRLEYENWMQHINLDPNQWTKHATPWFYNNEPSGFDQYQSDSPVNRAITAMAVRVPDFTRIQVDGPFQIQIVGRQAHNSVYVLGPNQLARHTAVDIKGDTLFIHPAQDCESDCRNLGQVIVRIGMREISGIVDGGSGPFEAKDIDSSCLDVVSTDGANMLLVGNLTVNHVAQKGNGTISILGATTPALDIEVLSNGILNISGRVNVHRIIKQGSGTLNIIGASSDGLMLKSSGSGVTAIAGYTNLKKVDVVDYSRVYIYWINSNGIYATVRDHARLGLAGAAQNLQVDVSDNGMFLGKYLRVNNIYVRTRDYSHANVDPSDKLFANAMDSSSIYFFNSPNVVSRYSMGNGIIIPVFGDACPLPAPRPTIYKDEGGFKAPTAYPTMKEPAPADPAGPLMKPQADATQNGEPSYRNESAWDKLLKG
jgi:hypothetical protein